jgi:hypothetical protein
MAGGAGLCRVLRGDFREHPCQYRVVHRGTPIAQSAYLSGFANFNEHMRTDGCAFARRRSQGFDSTPENMRFAGYTSDQT